MSFRSACGPMDNLGSEPDARHGWRISLHRVLGCAVLGFGQARNGDVVPASRVQCIALEQDKGLRDGARDQAGRVGNG